LDEVIQILRSGLSSDKDNVFESQTGQSSVKGHETAGHCFATVRETSGALQVFHRGSSAYYKETGKRSD